MNNTNNHRAPQSEEVLAEAVEQLAHGKSISTILVASGEHSDWLEPLLIQAAVVSRLGEKIGVPAVEEGLDEYLAKAEEIAAEQSFPNPAARWRERLANATTSLLRSHRRPLANVSITMLSLAVLLAIGSSIFFGIDEGPATEQVFPGHPLYALKRFGEGLVLSWPQSRDDRQVRSLRFESRRLQEVRLMQLHDREAQITFSGVVQAVDEHEVLVSGIVCPLQCQHDPPHMIGPSQVIGALTLGTRVSVDAYTLEDGTFHIERIVARQP